MLLALIWSNHRHHEAAHAWFGQGSAEGWATCLFTQSTFLRLSLNPQIVGVAIDCATAFQLLSELVRHPHHQYIESAPSLNGVSFQELMPKIVGYRQVSDAMLLHIARCHGAKLVTFDQSIAAVCPWQENLLALPPHHTRTPFP